MPIVPYNITPAFPEAIAPEDIRDKLLELLGLTICLSKSPTLLALSPIWRALRALQ